MDDFLSLGDYQSHVHVCQLDYHSEKYRYAHRFLSNIGLPMSGQSGEIKDIFWFMGYFDSIRGIKSDRSKIHWFRSV
ncbi:hypothetical protein D3C87_1837940 [compost metagenome]